MPTAFDIRPPSSDAELDVYAEILRACFSSPPEHARKSFERVGNDNILLIRGGGRVIGGLYLLPAGQWFGGRCVPTMGIAAVGIAPEARGSGAGRAVMDAALLETRRRGMALSTLYPATHTLYRRCGYELAGHHYEVTIDPSGIPPCDRSATVRPMVDADLPVAENLYRATAREHTGWLERTPYFWKRITEPRDGVPHARLIESGGEPVGYCIYLLERKGLHFQRMRVLDMVATTPAAAQRQLAYIADHRSVVNEVTWHGPANDAILMMLPERSYSVSVIIDWMVRLVDVPAALAARGYPQSLSAEIHFDVSDELFAENASRFVLAVSGGTGGFRAGGEGRIACDVRGLAALYSGYMTPEQLVRAGMLRGEPDDLSAAAAVFACGTPCMTEIF